MALENILGHGKQIELLRQAIQHGRVPHAYLFVGVEGSGKRLVAENLAKVLNCQNPVNPEDKLDACDECSACKKIANGTHPDVHLVEADGKYIKTEQLRDVLKAVSYKPYEGRWKIFLINDAERLHPHSANILLKTLEEPTDRTLFVLLTAYPNLLPSTILSRCQQVRFGGIPESLLVDAIREKTELDEDEAKFYAQLAEGSLGRALSLIEGELRTVADTHLKPLTQFLSRVNLDEKDGVEALFELAGSLVREKEELPLILELLRSWYRDLIMWQATKDSGLLIHRRHQDLITQHAESFSREELFRRLELVDKLTLDLAQNANKQLAVEQMLMSSVGY